MAVHPTAIIEGEVSIGAGTVVDPYAIIRGKATIGEDSYIGPMVFISAEAGEVRVGKEARISSHVVIYSHVSIGERVFIGHHTYIRSFTEIGNRVSIGSLNQIEGHCYIGDDTRFHSNVLISMKSRVGAHCFIAPGFVATNTPYPLARDRDKYVAGVDIEAHVKIGANVTTAPGVRVGKNSLIGIGSVVTKDIPPNSVAFGNPCTVRGDVRSLRSPDGSLVYESVE